MEIQNPARIPYLLEVSIKNLEDCLREMDKNEDTIDEDVNDYVCDSVTFLKEALRIARRVYK